jgi:hypothetical protein
MTGLKKMKVWFLRESVFVEKAGSEPISPAISRSRSLSLVSKDRVVT